MKKAVMDWWTRLVGVASVFLLGISLASADSFPRPEEFRQFVLDQHNEYRSKEGGADMNELVWDSQLESESKQWADRCVFEHQYKKRGENLAYNTDMDWKKTTVTAMKNWFDEKQQYHFFGARCSQSNACHYTQMVWAETRRVGCALKKCQSLGNSGSSMPALYLVCFYDPRGNFEWDQNHPYTKGAACSKCQADQTCKNKLCSGGKDPCFDKEEAGKCSMWANDMNQCEQNKAFMETSCKKSCGFCKGGPGKPAGKAPDGASHLKPEPGPACRDGRSACQAWARRGYCRTRPDYMLPNCKKSCNAC